MTSTQREARILQAVAMTPRATRRSIADFADLSIASLSPILAELLDRGWVTRAASSEGKGGRPSYLYGLSGSLGLAAGVSLDPDTLRVVCLDASTRTVESRSFPLELSTDPSRHSSQVVEQIALGLSKAMEGVNLPFLCAGVTLPGVTNADQGVWVQGFQVSGIMHVGIRRLLEERLRVPVMIEDPARAAAFRELRLGHGEGARSFVLLYLDYGVGSGIVLGGELHRGRDGLAGEVGHLIVDPNGYRCSCGDIGCLETVASTSGILRSIRDRLGEGVVSTLMRARDRDSITLKDVLGAADGGDRLAQSTLHEIGERIGSACATLIKLVNPERLIVSGAGAMFGAYFEPRMRMVLAKHVIPEMLQDLPIDFCDHAPEHEAHGAALFALEHYWKARAAEPAVIAGEAS